MAKFIVSLSCAPPALYAAVSLEPSQPDDYYALHPYCDDGGFLAAHIAACREVFASLPAREAVAEAARSSAVLYAEAQGICHATESGWQEPVNAKYTRIEARRHPELQWGEMIAAGASSLPVLALMVAATNSGCGRSGPRIPGQRLLPLVLCPAHPASRAGRSGRRSSERSVQSTEPLSLQGGGGRAAHVDRIPSSALGFGSPAGGGARRHTRRNGGLLPGAISGLAARGCRNLSWRSQLPGPAHWLSRLSWSIASAERDRGLSCDLQAAI